MLSCNRREGERDALVMCDYLKAPACCHCDSLLFCVCCNTAAATIEVLLWWCFGVQYVFWVASMHVGQVSSTFDHVFTLCILVHDCSVLCGTFAEIVSKRHSAGALCSR